MKILHRYQQNLNEESLVPQKRGPILQTRRTYIAIEEQIIELRKKGNNRYEIRNILINSGIKVAPSPTTIYNIWKRFIENPKENFRLVIELTSENIYLPEHFVELLKSEYDPEYYRINVLGEFGNYSSGLVVKNFTEENYTDLEYNRNMDLYLCCDFNVDPMCWEIAHKDNENFYFIDELCIENTCTQHCIEEFIRRYPDHASKIIVCGDASGNFRHFGAEFTNYMIIKQALGKYGYQVEFKLRNFNPPILNRIQAFNRQVCNANNERHVFVRKDRCQWLMYNIENLKFKEGTSIVDVPTLKTIKNDRDSKFLEHPFDAASYPVEFFYPIK